MKKSLLSLVASVALLGQAQAQCPSTPPTPGVLRANTIPLVIAITDTTPTPNFTVQPTGLPTTEFVITSRYTQSSDSLGPAIVSVSQTGIVDPQLIGLGICDEFYVTPFSYDIHQVRRVVHGILNDSISLFGPAQSCCSVAQIALGDICGALNTAGINDSSDISSMADLIVLLNAVSQGQGNPSIEGLTQSIDFINQALGQFTACSGGVTELCYAVEPLGYDYYLIRGANPVYTSVSVAPDTAFVTTQGGTVQFTAQGNPSSATDGITWTVVGPSGGSVSATGLFTAGSSGQYLVIARATNGCVRDTAVVVAQITSVEDLSSEQTWTVMPNPVKDQAQVSLRGYEGMEVQISLLSVDGRLLWAGQHYVGQDEYQVQVPTANLQPGMYLVQLQHAKGREVKKVVK